MKRGERRLTTGEKIKDLRIARSMSAEKLGNKIGVAKSTITRYENNDTKKIPVENLCRIATVLGVSADYFFETSDIGAYSKAFKKEAAETIVNADPADLEAANVNIGLLDELYGNKDITLESACEIADQLGLSLDLLFRNEKPASTEGDGLDQELLKRLVQLTPEEIMKVNAFVQGILAAREE